MTFALQSPAEKRQTWGASSWDPQQVWVEQPRVLLSAREKDSRNGKEAPGRSRGQCPALTLGRLPLLPGKVEYALGRAHRRVLPRYWRIIHP